MPLKKIAILIPAILMVGYMAFASKLRMEVTLAVPLLLPGETLYLASNFNAWNPGNEQYTFQAISGNRYFIEIDNAPSYFEYKLTQGSWDTVEGDTTGYSISNRQYIRSSDAGTVDTIQIQLVGWEDRPEYSFMVTSIPENTPHDASIFLSGNFNNWNPCDPNFKLVKQKDASYFLRIRTAIHPLEYKFTRGTWKSVEGKDYGQVMPNRISKYKAEELDQRITVSITSWEDLEPYGLFSIYKLLLLFSAFQGVLLLIAIPSIQDKNASANRLLLVLLGVTSLCLFLEVFSNLKPVADAYPKLILLPYLIIFIYPPLFHAYINRLLFNKKSSFRTWVWRLTPAFIYLVSLLPFFLMINKSFQHQVVNNNWLYVGVIGGFGVLGLLYNSWYWSNNWKSIAEYKNNYSAQYSHEQNLHYLNTVLFIQLVCLVLWGVSYLIGIVDWLLDLHWVDLLSNSSNLIWLLFSTTLYILGYYAIQQPEIFRLNTGKTSEWDDPEAVVLDMLKTRTVNRVGENQHVGMPNTLKVPASTDEALPRFTSSKQLAEPVPVKDDASFAEPKHQTDRTEDELADENDIDTDTSTSQGREVIDLEQFPEVSPEVKDSSDYTPEQVQALDDLMQTEKPYINPRLSLHELADLAGLQPYVLSRIINDHYQKNFFDFINFYRIEAFKEYIHNPKYQHYTFLALAHEVGFNSKTAFNRAFKKITQLTPREYFETLV